jgi:hypothetical protein
MPTLQDALESLKELKLTSLPKKKKISQELLGKFKGIIPAGKNSTQFIKELRTNLYGKVK